MRLKCLGGTASQHFCTQGIAKRLTSRKARTAHIQTRREPSSVCSHRIEIGDSCVGETRIKSKYVLISSYTG